MTSKRTKQRLDAETELYLKQYGRYLAFLRRHPTHSARVIFGIIIPPHESAILESAWMDYRNNIFKCSRGTSKTFTIGSLFAPIRSLLFKNTRILIASASRFRGGKMILKDSERMFRGHLANQKLEGKWAQGAINHTALIKHEPDMWSIDFNSASSLFTVPTNNEDALRGIRAHIMILDERNFFDDDAIQKVYKPFLVVGTDFENPAEGSSGNQMFSIGTIDYSYREWPKEIQAVKDLAKIQYEFYQALYNQDWEIYDSIKAQHGGRLKNFSAAFTRYDYTDLLIPTQIGKYKVLYPGARPGKDIKYDEREQQDLIYSYPVNKVELERDLDEGIIDYESWAAEHRNVFINATGSVYPPALVEKATGRIFTVEEEKKRGWEPENAGTAYIPPVLYECNDPCVLGLDTARSADFTAFVVIRVGCLPEEFYKNRRYSLDTHTGPSTWSNVIWCETHHHMTVKETTERIHELRRRYNIVATKHYKGITMDAKGGGVHVRDELALPSPLMDPKTGQPVLGYRLPQKIFDPDDEEYQHLSQDIDAWPGLTLLHVTDVINQELITFSKAQMEVSRLYVGAFKKQTERPKDDYSTNPGYLGVRTLKHQMLRIQAVPTAAGKSVRFEIPGDTKKLENKKDLLMSFLYACYGLRAIQTYYSHKPKKEPVAYGTKVRL